MSDTVNTYEIDELLEAAIEAAARNGTPVRLRRGTYRLQRIDEDIWSDYDPDLVDHTLDRYAGVWKDLDTDKLKENLYRAREAGSRPLSRP